MAEGKSTILKGKSKSIKDKLHSSKTPMLEEVCGWHERRKKGVKTEFLRMLYAAAKEEANAKKPGKASKSNAESV